MSQEGDGSQAVTQKIIQDPEKPVREGLNVTDQHSSDIIETSSHASEQFEVISNSNLSTGSNQTNQPKASTEVTVASSNRSSDEFEVISNIIVEASVSNLPKEDAEPTVVPSSRSSDEFEVIPEPPRIVKERESPPEATLKNPKIQIHIDYIGTSSSETESESTIDTTKKKLFRFWKTYKLQILMTLIFIAISIAILSSVAVETTGAAQRRVANDLCKNGSKNFRNEKNSLVCYEVNNFDNSTWSYANDFCNSKNYSLPTDKSNSELEFFSRILEDEIPILSDPGKNLNVDVTHFNDTNNLGKNCSYLTKSSEIHPRDCHNYNSQSFICMVRHEK